MWHPVNQTLLHQSECVLWLKSAPKKQFSCFSLASQPPQTKLEQKNELSRIFLSSWINLVLNVQVVSSEVNICLDARDLHAWDFDKLGYLCLMPVDACPQSRIIWGEDDKLWTTFIYLPCCEHSLLINLSCPQKCNYKNWWWTKKTRILQFLASNLLTVLTCQRKDSSFLNMHIFKIKKKKFQCLIYTQEVTLEVNRSKFVDLFLIYIACYPYSNFSLSEELQVNENSTVHFSKSTRFFFCFFR